MLNYQTVIVYRMHWSHRPASNQMNDTFGPCMSMCWWHPAHHTKVQEANAGVSCYLRAFSHVFIPSKMMVASHQKWRRFGLTGKVFWTSGLYFSFANQSKMTTGDPALSIDGWFAELKCTCYHVESCWLCIDISCWISIGFLQIIDPRFVKSPRQVIKWSPRIFRDLLEPPIQAHLPSGWKLFAYGKSMNITMFMGNTHYLFLILWHIW